MQLNSNKENGKMTILMMTNDVGDDNDNDGDDDGVGGDDDEDSPWLETTWWSAGTKRHCP